MRDVHPVSLGYIEVSVGITRKWGRNVAGLVVSSTLA